MRIGHKRTRKRRNGKRILLALCCVFVIFITFFNANIFDSETSLISPLIEPRLSGNNADFFWSTNISSGEIVKYCKKNKLRLIDIELSTKSQNSKEIKYDVLFGPNDKSENKKCWFLSNKSADELNKLLRIHNARALDLEIYGVNKDRFAAILVKKEIDTNKFEFFINVTDGSINTVMRNIKNNDQRVIDIEVYSKNKTIRYALLTVPNQNNNQKSWHWLHNVKKSKVLKFFNQNYKDMDMIDLERHEDGTYSAVFNQSKRSAEKRYLLDLPLNKIMSSLDGKNSRIIDIDRFKNDNGETRFNIIYVQNVREKSR